MKYEFVFAPLCPLQHFEVFFMEKYTKNCSNIHEEMEDFGWKNVIFHK